MGLLQIDGDATCLKVVFVLFTKISFIQLERRLDERQAATGIEPVTISMIIGLVTTAIGMAQTAAEGIIGIEQGKSADRAHAKMMKSEQDHYKRMQLRNRVPDRPNRGKATSYL